MLILGIIGIALLGLVYGLGVGIHLATFVMCMRQDYGEVAAAPKELQRLCLIETMLWPIRMWRHSGDDENS